MRLEESDWKDCQECLAGQREACSRLLKRHEPEIARQMWRFSRDRNVCEELVQEVLVEAYLCLRRYHPREVPFVHWLRCIATRVGYRFWKQEARRRRFLRLESCDAPAQPQDLEDPSAAAALLHDLLARLPAADRLVLTLMYFEECSLQQIAERTGWNVPMVKMRAMRARQKLRKMIERGKLLDQFDVSLKDLAPAPVAQHPIPETGT